MLMSMLGIARQTEAIKIKTTYEGICKLEGTELSSFLPALSSKSAKFLHLYYNGQEKPFYIKELNTAIGNNAIYFYTQKNDATLDKELYDKQGAALNPYASIYSDTSVYIITFDESKEGLYYKLENISTANTSIFNVNVEQIIAFKEQYFLGKNFGSGATQSEYTLGEGYSGVLWSMGNTQSRTFNLPNLVSNSKVELECYVSGQSDAIASNPNFNHHVQINLVGTGSHLLLDTMYRGYNAVRKKFNLNASLFSAANTLQFTSVNDLGAQSDFNSTPYIKLNYQQTTQLAQEKLFRFNLKNSSNSNLYFKGITADSMFLFDNSRHTYYTWHNQNDSVYYTIKASVNTNNYTLASLKQADVHSNVIIEKIELKKFDFNQEENDLIIISSNRLKQGAEAYRNYKVSKGTRTLLVYVEDLYDAYSYGYHHPIAITRFIKQYELEAKIKAKNIFIIGKGIQSNFYNNVNFARRDLVPSIGIPPSDILYVSSLNFSSLAPSMGIGRIAVENNEEVLNYLDKVIDQDLANKNAMWRKNIIHATGGRTISENTLFTSALKSCEDIAVQPLLGAKVLNFNKKVNEPVSDNYRERLVELTDEGISLLSYYGHGANYFVEINFGEPEALNNKGKYPVYYLSGCSVGNAAGDNSMGENYINAKNRGAIGWLASSDLGFTSYLAEYHRLFYLHAFNKNYSKSIGEIQQETIKEFAKSNDSLNILHTRQLFYQGDPSLHFYSPESPDYTLTANSLILTNKAFANNDSIELAFIVQNPGKAISDSVEYQLVRQAGINTITYSMQKRAAILNTDTLYFTVSKSKEYSGNNKFRLSIDPLQKIVEIDESNNSLEKELFLSSFSPLIVQPRNSSILKSDTLNLVVQCNDINAKNITYYVEIDTTKLFNSAYKKTLNYTADQLLQKKIKLGIIGVQKSIYVRVKLQNAQESSDWLEHECIYYPNNNAKWIQNKVSSLNAEAFSNISIKNNQLSFIDNTVEFAINTRGDNARADSVERRMRLNGSAPVFLSSGITGICLLALEPNSLQRYSYPSNYNLLANTPDYPFDKYKYSGVYVFNTNSPTDQDSLKHYLKSIPDNYVLAGYNGLNANISTLPEEVLQAFEEFGLSRIRTVVNGVPYAFVGYKGIPAGAAAEKLADPNSTIDPKNQFIRLNFTHVGTWDRGSIWSDKIGPANEWKSLAWKFEKSAEENIIIEVYTIDTNGNKTLLNSNLNATDSISLKSVNATTFPYVQMKVNFLDTINYTPATFKYWTASYQLPVELSVLPQHQYKITPTNTLQGDTIKYQFAFANIGEETVAQVQNDLYLENANRQKTLIERDTLLALSNGDTVLTNYKINTRNLLGNYKLISVLSPINKKENSNFNNSLEGNFTINKDVKQPKLSITIDGKIPMQNDLISPRPLINIKLNDDNPFLLLNDSAYLNIEIKRPNSTTYQSINYQSSEVSFIPATQANKNEMSVQYQPYFKEDGTYRLRIRVKDASNNNANNTLYELDFEVVNSSSITHFYPYPNPFTSHTQFVFTLTGEKIPDDMKIQIMTISGKIVREINMAELGPIRIGHNISDYKWNGTDEYGDRLANGVYLYKVVLKNANDFEQRSTAGDKYFNSGFGKLYLMK